MFKSFKYNKFVGHSISDHPLFQYTITDTEFETTIIFEDDMKSGLCCVLIQEYEKRNLNVPRNLILFAKYLSNDPVKEVNYWLNFPECKKYDGEIQKYLVLI